MNEIIYYFDFLSPYSYISWHKTRPMRENHENTFIFKPVLMTELFKNFEIKAPGEVAPKREFMLKQCYRFAHKNGLKFTPPLKHPFNPLYVLRMATVSASGDQQQRLIDAIWKIGWQMGKDIGDPDVLCKSLNEMDLNGQKLIDACFEASAKKELKTNTKEAKEKNVFGVPSWIYNNELFWGADAIEDLDNSLKNIDHWDRDNYHQALKNNPLI